MLGARSVRHQQTRVARDNMGVLSRDLNIPVSKVLERIGLCGIDSSFEDAIQLQIGMRPASLI